MSVNYVPMHEIKRLYGPGEGRHWFDTDTMRFFRCRLPDGGYQASNGRIYFVTSEKGPDGIRAYSVRCLKEPRGTIETIGSFQQYRSRSGANSAALRLAQQ